MRIQLTITKSGVAHFTVKKNGQKTIKHSYSVEEACEKLQVRSQDIALRWLARGVICDAIETYKHDPNPKINEVAQFLVEDAKAPAHTYGYVVFNTL